MENSEKPIDIITLERLHRELWFWLELNLDEYRFNWPGWEWYRKDFPEPENYSYCFACYYAQRKHGYCDLRCILRWRGENCTAGEYSSYNRAATLEQRAEVSKIIRCLPWRDEEKKDG